jgi:hypothetical protein
MDPDPKDNLSRPGELAALADAHATVALSRGRF